MADSNLLISAIVPPIVIGVLSFLMGSRKGEATASRDGSIVEYGIFWKALTGLFSAVPPVILIAGFVWPPSKPEDALIPYYLAGGFAALVVPLWLEVFRRRVILREKGLESLSPWTGRRFIPWEGVTKVTFSPASQYFVIEGRSGGPIRLSMYMSGMQTLGKLLNANAPSDVSLQAIGIPTRSPTPDLAP